MHRMHGSGYFRLREGAKVWVFVWLIALAAGWLLPPAPAMAHAGLLQAVPAAGSELAEPPSAVTLTFNERLETGVYYLRVYDMEKRKVTERPAAMNEARTTVTLELPELGKGTYLATYHVISADGHPVQGSYLFAVGQSLDAPSAANANEALEQMHRHGGELATGLGTRDVLQFAARIAFFISMLTLTGWALWYRWFALGRQEALRAKLGKVQAGLQQLYAVAYILFMGAHLGDLIGDGGTEGLISLFTKTTIGPAWLAGLVLALLSFVCLQRGPWLTYIWVAAVWLGKSLLGHAAAFEPKSQTLLLDWLHLGASAVWVGGLVMLLYLFRADQEAARPLLPAFSSAALLSIIVLAVTGTLSAFIFLPNIEYVLETAWGRWLLVKTGVVLLVVITAALIRYAYRKKQERTVGLLIRLDAAWMASILIIVGIFTYLTPMPSNAPLQWHVMGERIHMTTQISPNAPGVNDFTVKVWLLEQFGPPKQVIVKLQSPDTPDIAPFEVPVTPVEDTSVDEDFGMKRYTFKAKGPYLPYAGTWHIEVRVMNSQDDETVYKKEIRIY
ncbi:copper transport protein [Paenibacillus sp. UNCCL117]|uniref:copper resistance CopC/CopD family protein n=1 Tax=unclassified Paenibacillus TaxID=185978 RepID=UPI000886CC16|nr:MULTISPECIES: copper resistance protein CopC [unclassified Paenibacillus]SDB99437.1 copper transport protein [Paenibacillus sp. cl123]SFW69126.1 copper transport protein [Paenibacillus sp. UNCCL117]